MKLSIVGSLRDREVACSASDRQGSNFESCVWRTVSSHSSHHPICAQRWPKARFISFVNANIILLCVIVGIQMVRQKYIFYNMLAEAAEKNKWIIWRGECFHYLEMCSCLHPRFKVAVIEIIARNWTVRKRVLLCVVIQQCRKLPELTFKTPWYPMSVSSSGNEHNIRIKNDK